MTAKEYLWRVRDAERELKRLEQEYAQARADILQLRSIQYDADKVSGNKIGDLSDAIASIEGYAGRLNAQWDKLIKLREDAKRQIDTMQDGRYREVLTLRYIRGQSWEQVAVTMGYDYYYVHKLHGAALKKFPKIQNG